MPRRAKLVDDRDDEDEDDADDDTDDDTTSLLKLCIEEKKILCMIWLKN